MFPVPGNRVVLNVTLFSSIPSIIHNGRSSCKPPDRTPPSLHHRRPSRLRHRPPRRRRSNHDPSSLRSHSRSSFCHLQFSPHTSKRIQLPPLFHLLCLFTCRPRHAQVMGLSQLPHCRPVAVPLRSEFVSRMAGMSAPGSFRATRPADASAPDPGRVRCAAPDSRLSRPFPVLDVDRTGPRCVAQQPRKSSLSLVFGNY